MKNKISSEWFDKTNSVIADPLKFKSKLAIGEDAYTSLRVKNAVFKAWNMLGVAGTAASIARSSIVASKFFAPSGFFATIGIGGTAATPLGWIVAASVVSGGAWVGITKLIKKKSGSRVIVIPNFINTPMDILAVGLFDLIVPLALKVAIVDGNICDSEKKFINDYFVNVWGYDFDFVKEGTEYIESNLSNFSIKGVAYKLAEFQKENPDCNYQEMKKEILLFLQAIIESDGIVDEREEIVIEKIGSIFDEAGKFNIKKTLSSGIEKIMYPIRRAVKKTSHS